MDLEVGKSEKDVVPNTQVFGTHFDVDKNGSRSRSAEFRTHVPCTVFVHRYLECGVTKYKILWSIIPSHRSTNVIYLKFDIEHAWDVDARSSFVLSKNQQREENLLEKTYIDWHFRFAVNCSQDNQWRLLAKWYLRIRCLFYIV